jgi:hypothetical protein
MDYLRLRQTVASRSGRTGLIALLILAWFGIAMPGIARAQGGDAAAPQDDTQQYGSAVWVTEDGQGPSATGFMVNSRLGQPNADPNQGGDPQLNGSVNWSTGDGQGDSQAGGQGFAQQFTAQP